MFLLERYVGHKGHHGPQGSHAVYEPVGLFSDYREAQSLKDRLSVRYGVMAVRAGKGPTRPCGYRIRRVTSTLA